MFQTKVAEKIKIYISCHVTVFRKSSHVWDNDNRKTARQAKEIITY